MKNLTHFDSEYNKSISDTFEKLKAVYSNINNNYRFDLSNTEITEAILNRLKIYYETQNNIKTFLDKRYLAAGSDFFVESTLFFLKLYFKSQGDILQAHSERQIKQKRNAIRPDISIWKDNEVIAIIECKTQLGWNRHNWEQQYVDRDKKLQADFPNAKSFLLVMTGLNWSGFGDNSKLSENYFCLLNDIWPNNYSDKSQIFTPIEKLFQQLK
jgi:hypothetical protein